MALPGRVRSFSAKTAAPVPADEGCAVWKLIYVSDADSTATLYPMLTNLDGVVNVLGGRGKGLRVAKRNWEPLPVVSDSCNRANSSTLGNTDGAGHAEANGGGGLLWTEDNGDWEIASNRLSPKGAGPALPRWVATVDSGQSDIFLSVIVNHDGTGAVGPVVRYTSADDKHFAINIEDGSPGTFKIREYDGASFTDRASATPNVSTSTDHRIKVVCDGQTITAYFAGGDRISYGSASVNETVTVHGMRSNSTGDTIDDFVIWPREWAGFPNL